MPVLTDSERVGTTIGGKYRLDRIVGRGGVGTVFAGVHAWTGREVAVKMLHVQHAEDPAVVDRFLREARAAAALRHPNVVDVLDMGQDGDGAVYLVLEYLDGESLAQCLERRGRLSEEETATTLLPIMDALAEAHDLGIVHRDIKPENVFLALDAKRRTIPKLLDFGIAKVFAEGSSRATRTGTVVGTPAYMSPEQVDGRSNVGPSTDIWSMGVLLFECLSGGLPFPSDSPTATLVAVLTTPAPPLRSVAPATSAPLALAVDRALMREVSMRWPTMRELASAVTAAVDALDGEAVTVIAASRISDVQPPQPQRPPAEEPGGRRVPPTMRMEDVPAALPSHTGEPRTPASPQRTSVGLVAGGIAATLLLVATLVVALLVMSNSSSPSADATRTAPTPSTSPASVPAVVAPDPTPASPVVAEPTIVMTPDASVGREVHEAAQLARSPSTAARSPEPRDHVGPSRVRTDLGVRGEEGAASTPPDVREVTSDEAEIGLVVPDVPTRAEVVGAMSGVERDVARCGNGYHGSVVVNVTFSGSGEVTSAVVVGELADTPAAMCIEETVRTGVLLPRFRSSSYRASYPFRI